MKEEWKVIEDYPNYEVSNLGRVRNIKTSRVLRPVMVCGYQQVGLYSGGKQKHNSIHRLVATTFISNPECKREVNHINGIKTDNRVENLEWNTRSENVYHSYKTGLKEGPSKQKIRCVETNQIFESQCQVARYFGCSQESVWQSIHKGSKVLKKYHFELTQS